MGRHVGEGDTSMEDTIDPQGEDPIATMGEGDTTTGEEAVDTGTSSTPLKFPVLMATVRMLTVEVSRVLF